MSPHTMQMTASLTVYTPTSDAMDRHDYGVTKNRKTASTGGGRAWSEDEEVYLLHTRLQKMTYKHIAAHLKKTELACRLHYHQLSHGSNRRKRTTSVSSGSSTGEHSPHMPANLSSPIREASIGRSVSPRCSSGSYGLGSPIQLPAIMGRAGSASDASPTRLPAILPKPAGMPLALSTSVSALNQSSNIACSTLTNSPTTSRGYPTPLAESSPHLPSVPASVAARASLAPLRLDYTSAPSTSSGMTSAHSSQSVDMIRLGAVYAAHRSAFWAAVASEYGHGASPAVLESAWKNGPGAQPLQTPCSAAASTPSLNSNGTSSHGQGSMTPMTPVTRPDGNEYTLSGRMGLGLYGAQQSGDKTRISAILGIDVNPRSPKERVIARRMEEGRGRVVLASARGFNGVFGSSPSSVLLRQGKLDWELKRTGGHRGLGGWLVGYDSGDVRSVV